MDSIQKQYARVGAGEGYIYQMGGKASPVKIKVKNPTKKSTSNKKGSTPKHNKLKQQYYTRSL